MKQKERMLAFFGAMLIAFGVSLLDMENPAFSNNQKEYIAMVAGFIFLVVFYFNRYRNRSN